MISISSNFNSDNWKSALDNLKEIYSDSQIAVMLGLSHSAVVGKLNKFSYTSYEKQILDINNKLDNNHPQILFFKNWCNRLLKNDYALTYRAIRQSLQKSNKSLGLSKSYRNLTNYENNTNIMPKKVFMKFLDYLKENNIKYEKESLRSYKFFVKKQVKEFIDNKFYLLCPSILRILPYMKTVEGIAKEYEIYDDIKKIYQNTFLGCIFSKDLKKTDNLDILVFNNKEIIVFEIKDFKQVTSCIRRRINETNNRLKILRESYKEITKTIVILPSVNVSKEIKEKFLRNSNIILDKTDYNCFLRNKKINSFVMLKNKGITNVQDWLKKVNISSYMLELLFGMNNIRTSIRNILRPEYNFIKITSRLNEIEKILNKYDKRQLHFLINKFASLRDREIVFLRNLRKAEGISLSDICFDLFNNKNKNKNKLASIESGKKKLKWLKKEYKKYILSRANNNLKSKAKFLIKEENIRWKIAKDFPMIVGLSNYTNNELENYVLNFLAKREYKTIKNGI